MIKKKRTMNWAYLATPSRIVKEKKEKILEICMYTVEQGALPMHPFNAFPYECYEGHELVRRDEAMASCFDLVALCDEFWLFGVSHGTMQELVIAKDLVKPVRLHLEYDTEWKDFYKKLAPEYGRPLDDMLEMATLL